MKDILIYKDLGADPIGVQCIFESLRQAQFDQRHSIRFIDRHSLKNSDWCQETCLLIFPGGRDAPYHLALRGIGNTRIQNFVQSGGSYLGICAGGYYGSACIEFEKGCPLEGIDERELKFFPGLARGSAYGVGQFCYRTSKGSRIASLSLVSKEQSAAYFKGGCMFVEAEKYPNVSILARYSDIEGTPPAIVKCTVGKGRAVLSGVHPEYSVHHPEVNACLDPQVQQALAGIEEQRQKLFEHLVISALDLITQKTG